MRDGVRAVMRRAAIATMRRAMASAARPTTNALRCVRTELLDARSETRRWDVTRALTGAHAPWSFAARGISNTAPTRGDDDKDAPAVTSPSGNATNDVQATAQDSADKRKDLYMMFTCGKCETRAAKGFSRQAYENGVVIVRCPGCQVQHLVADRYGWFGEPGSVEDFLGSRGETVVTGRAGAPGIESEDGTLEIDREQLEAWTAKQARGAGKTGGDV